MLTSNIQKGGALLADCRAVVEVWEPDLGREANLDRIASENLLGKASRTRAEDVLRRVIIPRLVEPGPQVIAALKVLLPDSRAFREACYYESGRDDALLAAFAEGPLFEHWQAGRLTVRVVDVADWLVELGKAGEAPVWSDTVRTKVARGLLAALRDFGVLRGDNRKDIAPAALSTRGFAYAAWREHEQGASSRALASSRVWRRWLLDDHQVTDLFGQAARLGVLRFSQAGSAVRIDWLAHDLTEVARAAA
jgi:hypothetical protein